MSKSIVGAQSCVVAVHVLRQHRWRLVATSGKTSVLRSVGYRDRLCGVKWSSHSEELIG